MKREYRTAAELIKEERKLAGMTQMQLASATGIEAANLRKYENKRQKPKEETIVRIAKGLGLTAMDISYRPDGVRYTVLEKLEDEQPAGVVMEPDPEGLEKLDGPWQWSAGGLGLSGAGLQIIGGSAGQVTMGPEDLCTGLPNVKPDDVHTEVLPMKDGADVTTKNL